MKRPQFSLRLMLLALALVAAFLSWRVAERDWWRQEHMLERTNLESYLETTNQDLVEKVRNGKKAPQIEPEYRIYHAIKRLEELK